MWMFLFAQYPFSQLCWEVKKLFLRSAQGHHTRKKQTPGRMEFGSSGRLCVSRRHSASSPLDSLESHQATSEWNFFKTLSKAQLVWLYPYCWEDNFRSLFLSWLSQKEKVRLPTTLRNDCATQRLLWPLYLQRFHSREVKVDCVEHDPEFMSFLDHLALCTRRFRFLILQHYEVFFRFYNFEFFQYLRGPYRFGRPESSLLQLRHLVCHFWRKKLSVSLQKKIHDLMFEDTETQKCIHEEHATHASSSPPATLRRLQAPVGASSVTSFAAACPPAVFSSRRRL
jgi:hypothetical protein